jgi:hypothetical protein
MEAHWPALRVFNTFQISCRVVKFSGDEAVGGSLGGLSIRVYGWWIVESRFYLDLIDLPLGT